MSNFLFTLCSVLIKNRQLRVQKNLQGYRKIFVNTWFLMLQNYITKRAVEIRDKQEVIDERISFYTRKSLAPDWLKDVPNLLYSKFSKLETCDAKQTEANIKSYVLGEFGEKPRDYVNYLANSGYDFLTLLKFWQEATFIDSSKEILVPSDDLVMKIRK